MLICSFLYHLTQEYSLCSSEIKSGVQVKATGVTYCGPQLGSPRRWASACLSFILSTQDKIFFRLGQHLGHHLPWIAKVGMEWNGFIHPGLILPLRRKAGLLLFLHSGLVTTIGSYAFPGILVSFYFTSSLYF